MTGGLKIVHPPPSAATTRRQQHRVVADGGGFPAFLPKEVEKIRDPFARALAQRIVRLPVPLQIRSFRSCVMSSCIKPSVRHNTNPLVLLHCFDSSCLEWRRAYPLLEQACLETWAIDVLGWGFSDLEHLPPCDAASKRHHLFQLWKTYIKRPVILVGPSLGASAAIDFAATYPEAVEKLVLINANAYSEGTGRLTRLPRLVAYAGVTFLKSFPLRLMANVLAFNSVPLSKNIDWTNVGRLHCQMPRWEDSTIDFMISGGYNVGSQIKLINQKTLIICSENDHIVSNQLSVKLLCELPNAIMREVPDCGHLPHVENPERVVNLISGFARENLL